MSDWLRSRGAAGNLRERGFVKGRQSRERVLFIGEAPPRPGGFWRLGNSDAVRRLLFPGLPGSSRDVDPASIDAVKWFVEAGFFFVQAVEGKR